MMLITSIWLITYLKVFKASYCRLMYHLPLEAFACLEVWSLGHDGSVLLSIVAKALLCNFCVQVPPLLSFPAKPLTAVSGKSRLLSAEFRTGARRIRRVPEGGLHLYGEVNVLDRRVKCFRKYVLSFENSATSYHGNL
jgi:hypothetical protein